jgi:exopolyphosphatase/guanosine-5'-triphosphate,3'-diphosphate pyrophosphatase
MSARHPSRGRAPVEPRFIGVIDVGTNSVKLTVGRVAGARVDTVYFERQTTRLGRGLVRSGRISARAAERTARVVRRLSRRAAARGAREVVAVGTFALRTASNGRRVARLIEERAGIAVRVLTGPEEARLAYRSARACISRPRLVTFLIDVGGGSTEFVAARAGVVRFVRSVPLGALRLKEKHLRADPIAPGEYRAMQREIDAVVSRLLAPFAGASPASLDFVASGGSATTAVDMIRGRFGSVLDHPARVTLSQLRGIEARCLGTTIARRKRLPGLPPDRADIIPAGLAIVIAFLVAARKRSLLINPGGLREGLILALSARGVSSPRRSASRGRRPAAATRSR